MIYSVSTHICIFETIILLSKCIILPDKNEKAKKLIVTYNFTIFNK